MKAMRQKKDAEYVLDHIKIEEAEGKVKKEPNEEDDVKILNDEGARMGYCHTLARGIEGNTPEPKG